MVVNVGTNEVPFQAERVAVDGGTDIAGIQLLSVLAFEDVVRLHHELKFILTAAHAGAGSLGRALGHPVHFI